MIEFHNINKSIPYRRFEKLYKQAIDAGQEAIEAISISSLNKENLEVESRFVNLKYIIDNEWVFFSNYDSKKSLEFQSHNQISALLYWKSIDTQVRMKAKICKTSEKLSDDHFNKRSKEKNALAVSSQQSQKISSFEEVIQNYETALIDKNLLRNRPKYWGGFSFTPYYFEFWKGNKSRLNKREVYIFRNTKWDTFLLQP